MKFNKKKNPKKSRSNVLMRPAIQYDENILGEKYEEVIRTTDAMNLISTAAQSAEDMSKQLAQSAEAISRNYELARRKITSIYQEVLSSGNFVSTPFLSIQVLLREYKEKWDVKYVEQTINIFFEELFNVLSTGTSVRLTSEILLDAIFYSNKILPSAKIVPSVTSEIKLLEWIHIFYKAVERDALLDSDKKIIETLVEAIETNVNVGYYIKIGDMILSRIRVDRPELVLLFSNHWLQELNHKYKISKIHSKKKRVSKANFVESFSQTQKQLINGQEEIVVESKPNPETKIEKKVDVVAEKEMEKKAKAEERAAEKQAKLNAKEEANRVKADKKAEANRSKADKKAEANRSKADKNEGDLKANETSTIPEDVTQEIQLDQFQGIDLDVLPDDE